MSTKLVNEMEKGNIKCGTMPKVRVQNEKACSNYIDVAGCTTGKFPSVHGLTKINFSSNEFNNMTIA